MTNGEGCGMWFDPAKFVAGVLIPPHVTAKRFIDQRDAGDTKNSDRRHEIEVT